MENITALLDSLAPYSWPTVVLISISIFKNPIKELITRITSINTKGFTVDRISDIQKKESQKNKKKDEATQRLTDGLGNSPVVNEFISNIQSEIRKLESSELEYINGVLIRHLAATQVYLNFEQIHHLIFGSQIKLLERLNLERGQGISRLGIEVYFQSVQKEFQEFFGNSKVDPYLSFLDARYLIEKKNNFYHITETGIEYLSWIIRVGKTEFKNF